MKKGRGELGRGETRPRVKEKERGGSEEKRGRREKKRKSGPRAGKRK
jgi:hypothetical protein